MAVFSIVWSEVRDLHNFILSLKKIIIKTTVNYALRYTEENMFPSNFHMAYFGLCVIVVRALKSIVAGVVN